MEAKRDKIARIFNESFPENPSWNKWFFNRVFDADEGWTLTRGGNVVSVLMLMRYNMRYLGRELPMAYIFGAATAQQMRGKGYMGELMKEAIRGAYARGDVFASLIPTRDSLYFFYDKFGFTTAVYLDCERYTSGHRFVMDGGYAPVAPSYAVLRHLEEQRRMGVTHTPSQYAAILENLKMSGGGAFAVEDVATGNPAAMAFVAPSHDGRELEVRDLLTVNDDAKESVLSQAMASFPEKPTVVWSCPGARKVRLRARAMLRLIDVESALETMAQADKEIDQVIRVHDKIIAENNGIFILHRGTCTRMDSTMRRVTLDVDVSTLTAILFSTERVGAVFGLRTSMASMAMMVE